MNPTKKRIIKSYLKDYLELRFKHLRIKYKKSFKCPFCDEHENDNGKDTAVIYEDKPVLFCFHPPHKAIGDIFQVAKKVEKKEHLSDDSIGEYLIHLLDIKIGEDNTDKLLNLYKNSGFALFPCIGGNSDPKMNKKPIIAEWQKSDNKNIVECKQWIENGNNIALNLGKVSDVIAIDIDSDETYEKVKHLLGDTLSQTTKRGKHFLYNYDSDFKKTINRNFRNAGYEMELRTDGAYIIIAPSSVDGEVREWNYKKIIKMPKELKEFCLKHQGEIEENTTDKSIQIDINQNNLCDIKLQGLVGCCDDSLVRYGGILRKKLNIDGTKHALWHFNNMLDEPVSKKRMFSIFNQIEKYNTYDKKELADVVLDRLEIVEESTAFKLASSMKYEQTDVEEVLKYLLDEEKITKEGDKVQRTKKANWRTDFMNVEKPCLFPVPYFDEVSYFKNGSIIVIGAVTGTGKCFGKGTKILMHDGSYKNVENIIVNDKVMGIDSNPRNVMNLSCGKDTMYKIIPNKGQECVVNSRHVLSLKNTTTKKITNISLDEYLESSNKFKHLNKLYKVPIDFKERQTSLEPYYLGLWLGDGSSSSQQIHNPDIEIKKYLKEYSDKIGLKFKCHESKDKCPYISLVGNKTDSYNTFNIQRELRKLNLINNKHIPDIYKINSRKNRLELLAGLLDTDGYLDCGGFEIITKSNKLAEDIIYLGRSLGFYVGRSIKKVKLKGWTEYRDYNRLYISGDCSIIPTKIKRKQAKPRKINKDVLVTGFKIEKLTNNTYYGFELDGDHLHLVEDFTVHHNTSLVGNMLKFYKEHDIKPYLLSSEKTSGISDVACKLGLVEGDFQIFNSKRLQNIELEDNAVTIIDWLRPVDSQYFKMDSIFEALDIQVNKHGGLLIVMVQLRSSNRNWYAPDLIEFNSYLSAKYLHSEIKDSNGNVIGYDRENTYFEITKMRKTKNKRNPARLIPTKWNPDTDVIEKRK